MGVAHCGNLPIIVRLDIPSAPCRSSLTAKSFRSILHLLLYIDGMEWSYSSNKKGTTGPTCFEEDQVEERMLFTTVVDMLPSVLFLFVTSTKVDTDPRLTFTCVDGTSVQMKPVAGP
jgi:hypothetical protein